VNHLFSDEIWKGDRQFSPHSLCSYQQVSESEDAGRSHGESEPANLPAEINTKCFAFDAPNPASPVRDREATVANTPRIRRVFSGMPEHARKVSATQDSVAERVGFEPTVPLPVRLISNQVRSTKLRHLSAGGETSS
jgi:hypothetical protein